MGKDKKNLNEMIIVSYLPKKFFYLVQVLILSLRCNSFSKLPNFQVPQHKNMVMVKRGWRGPILFMGSTGSGVFELGYLVLKFIKFLVHFSVLMVEGRVFR